MTPSQLGAALARQLGGRVVIRAGDSKHFVTQLVRGSRRDAFVVELAAEVERSRSDLKRAIAQWEACLRLDPQHARATARLKEARQLQARMQRIEDAAAPK